MKKIFYGLIVMLLFVSINVYATEAEDVLAEITPNDVLTLDAYKPAEVTMDDKEFYLSAYLRNKYPDKNYHGGLGDECNADVTECTIYVLVGEESASKKVSVVWKENDADAVKKVTDALSRVKSNATYNEEENLYLYYANDIYWVQAFLFEADHGYERVADFTNLGGIIGDGDITYYSEFRMGDGDEFFDMGGGSLVLSNKGIIAGMMDRFAVRSDNVLYLPDDVELTNDAIIEFVKSRVDNENVKIEAVGKRSEFVSEYGEGAYDFSKLGDESKMSEYYFSMTYKNQKRLFVVIKDQSKMEAVGEEPVFKLTYDFNGGKRQGESEYVDESVSVGMDITKANFIDNFTVTPPEGMELDAIEINGTRTELGSEYLLDKDTTFKYLWKKVATTEPEEVVVENKDNKIKIVFTSEELPDDIEVKVKEIGNKDKEFEEITKVLKTENFKAFDISLESKTKGPITKLDNGKFKVTVFLGTEFVGKKVTAYYIKDDGTLEKYAVEIDKDGYATFETPHFSTYIFAVTDEVEQSMADAKEEKAVPDKTNSETKTVGEEVPKTFDNITYYYGLLIISIVAMVGAFVFKKKYN